MKRRAHLTVAPRTVGPWQAAMIKLGLRTLGRLSPEIRFALSHGFASGVAVERVYNNQPGPSWTGVGRWLDGLYLGAPANVALRERQAAVERAVAHAACALARQGVEVRLFDPAAGAGRTGIGQVCREKASGTTARAVLGDHAPSARDAAREAAQRDRVADRVTVVNTDAFDPASLQAAALAFAPNVMVVGGLYELQPDDAAVRRSLAALAQLATPDAWLVLTGMNAHPQSALVARLTGVCPPPGRSVDALARFAGAHGFGVARRLPGVRGVFDVVVLERAR